MSLPSTINIQTALNVGVPTPVFNISDLTPYNTETVTLNNVKGNFTIVNPQGVTVYNNTSLTTPDVYFFAITSISQVAGVATVTTPSSHGLVTGDTVLIGTASQSGYNISALVIVTGLTTFTYLVDSGTATPATGTPRGLRISLNSIQIPLDSGTNMPILGIYTITETITISGGTEAGTYVKAFSYTNNYTRPIVSIVQSVNCFIARFVSTDTTSYSVNGISPTLGRTQNITFPSASGIPVATFVTQRVQIDRPKVWNGIYVTSIRSILSYTFSDNLIILDTVSGSQAFTVSCQDICNINCCLNDANKAYTTSLQSSGADSPRTVNYLAVFTRAMQLADLFQVNIQCGNTTDAAQNLQDIYTVTGCSTDCGCGSNTGEVIPYDGLVGKTILEWDVTIANSQGDYINYNNYFYKVLNNTLAGYSPLLNPTFYQAMGIPTWGSITGTLSAQTDLQSALNNKMNAFISSNIYTGSSSVTGNAVSGILNITLAITAGTNQIITFSNSQVLTSSIIQFYKTINTGNGLPWVIDYKITGTGTVQVILGNAHASTPTSTFTLPFQIIG